MFDRSAHAGGEVVRFRMARTLLGRPVYVTSSYRVGSLLVDTGCPRGSAPFLEALRRHPPRVAVITHGHEDHAGNVGLLPRTRAHGAPGLRVARGVPFYRWLTWGEPRPGPVAPLEGPLEVDGLEVRPFPTPGHTPDHLAYWVPDRGWLFAGDAALGKLKYGFRDEDIQAYLASLRRMQALKPEVVFPSHGPVLERPAEQLGEQIAHLERLRDEARRLAHLGEAAATRRLLGVDGVLGRVSGGEFSKRLLIRGLLRDPPGAAGPSPREEAGPGGAAGSGGKAGSGGRGP